MGPSNSENNNACYSQKSGWWVWDHEVVKKVDWFALFFNWQTGCFIKNTVCLWIKNIYSIIPLYLLGYDKEFALSELCEHQEASERAQAVLNHTQTLPADMVADSILRASVQEIKFRCGQSLGCSYVDIFSISHSRTKYHSRKGESGVRDNSSDSMKSR